MFSREAKEPEVEYITQPKYQLFVRGAWNRRPVHLFYVRVWDFVTGGSARNEVAVSGLLCSIMVALSSISRLVRSSSCWTSSTGSGSRFDLKIIVKFGAMWVNTWYLECTFDAILPVSELILVLGEPS